MKIAIDEKQGAVEFADMGGFRAHDAKLGRRLERLQALGPAGLSRRFASDERNPQGASAAKQDNGVSQQAGSVQPAQGGRPRTGDGRFGKRGGPAGEATGSG